MCVYLYATLGRINTKELVRGVLQMLNAEEELKRRSSMQGMVVRPSVSLQVDVTNDSGSMTRHAAARLGSEANLEMEGCEGDEHSNHNFHSRHIFRMNSTSPSSESPLRRPSHIQHNVVMYFGSYYMVPVKCLCIFRFCFHLC